MRELHECSHDHHSSRIRRRLVDRCRNLGITEAQLDSHDDGIPLVWGKALKRSFVGFERLAADCGFQRGRRVVRNGRIQLLRSGRLIAFRSWLRSRLTDACPR
jgi:hypothetical protein